MAEQPLSISLLLSAWWQAFGAGAAATAVAAGLLYWLARSFANRQARGKGQEAQIRSRIAANLHDELGSMLMRIQLQAELLLVRPGGNQAGLQQLLDATQAASAAMRDVAWGLDAEADTLNSLQDRMRDLLDQLALSTALPIRFAVEGLEGVAAVPARLRQELYLVFKEATTNALRHAQAPTYLAVRLYRQKDDVVLEVQDDGGAPEGPDQDGMGLRNMRRRAHAVGGTLVAGPLPGGLGYRVRMRAGLGALGLNY